MLALRDKYMLRQSAGFAVHGVVKISHERRECLTLLKFVFLFVRRDDVSCSPDLLLYERPLEWQQRVSSASLQRPQPPSSHVNHLSTLLFHPRPYFCDIYLTCKNISQWVHLTNWNCTFFFSCFGVKANGTKFMTSPLPGIYLYMYMFKKKKRFKWVNTLLLLIESLQ